MCCRVARLLCWRQGFFFAPHARLPETLSEHARATVWPYRIGADRPRPAMWLAIVSPLQADRKSHLVDRNKSPGSRSDGLVCHPVYGGFGGVLLGVIQVLAIVPEASWNLLAIDSDRAGPCCSASSAIRHDLKYWRLDLIFATDILEAILPWRREASSFDVLGLLRDGWHVGVSGYKWSRSRSRIVLDGCCFLKRYLELWDI